MFAEKFHLHSQFWDFLKLYTLINNNEKFILPKLFPLSNYGIKNYGKLQFSTWSLAKSRNSTAANTKIPFVSHKLTKRSKANDWWYEKRHQMFLLCGESWLVSSFSCGHVNVLVSFTECLLKVSSICMQLCAGIVCLTSILAVVFATRQISLHKQHRSTRKYWCFDEDSKSLQWRQRPQHKNETESWARNAHVFDFNANYNRNRNREQNIIFSHMTNKKTGHNML